MIDKVRVAVAGAGYFAQFHYDAWSRMPQAELVALADVNREQADSTAIKFSVPRVFDDLDEMLAETSPDLLDIVLPPKHHAGAIELACASGVHAICQKPFCGGLDQATVMAARAHDAGILLVVHENFRFQPWYRELARGLAAGDVGVPRQITFRLRPGDGQGERAYLDRQPYFQTMPRFLIHETGIHFVDTFRYLMGEIDAVCADLRRLNPAIRGEDAALVQFRFADNSRGLFDGNRLIDHAANNRRLTMGEMWLEGDGGTLRVDGDGRIFLRSHGSNDEHGLEFTSPATGFGGDSVKATQQHVVDHLLTGTPLENDATSYLVNQLIEEAIYHSADCRCWVDIADFLKHRNAASD